jgi:hypothetical protein
MPDYDPRMTALARVSSNCELQTRMVSYINILGNAQQ